MCHGGQLHDHGSATPPTVHHCGAVPIWISKSSELQIEHFVHACRDILQSLAVTTFDFGSGPARVVDLG